MSSYETVMSAYCESLADEHRDELGFLPDHVYTTCARAGRVIPMEEGSLMCGFLIHGPPNVEMKIYATCTELKLRRIHHATAAVAEAIYRANEAKCPKLILHCRDDLEANGFWKALGFSLVGQRVKNKHTGIPQNKFELRLAAGDAYELKLMQMFPNQQMRKLLETFGMGSAFEAFLRKRWRRDQRLKDRLDAPLRHGGGASQHDGA